jgi:hypothetical protein
MNFLIKYDTSKKQQIAEGQIKKIEILTIVDKINVEARADPIAAAPPYENSFTMNHFYFSFNTLYLMTILRILQTI